jgi:fucose permease
VFCAVAVATGLHALCAWRAPADPAQTRANADASSRTAAFEIAARPQLWWLLFAAACCTLLDEVLVALAALHLQRDAGDSAVLSAAMIAGFSLGALAGAAVTERLLQRCSARAVLIASALASAAALALFIVAALPWVAASALWVLGAAAAPQYPLVKAAAYALAPGRPGLVQALAQAFVALEAMVPLALGVLAERHGVTAALAALALQPLVVLAVALRPRTAA